MAPTAKDPFELLMDLTRLTAFTMPFNLTGQPAISLPLHWTSDEALPLPVGVQLAAAHGDLLRYDADAQIVVRADAPVSGKVALISGGGSGRLTARRL